MFIFIHLILGILIGLGFESKTLIIITALLSHFLLDYLPHWDGWFDNQYFEKTGIANLTRKDVYKLFIDCSLTILAIFLFWHYAHYTLLDYNKTDVAIGAFTSILPDILGIGYATKLKERKTYNKFLKFHSKIQKKSNDTNWKLGLIIQALFLISFILSIIYILFF